MDGHKRRPGARKRGAVRAALWLLAVLTLMPAVLTLLYSFFSPEEISELLARRGFGTEWLPLRAVPRMASLGQYYHVMLGNTGLMKRYILSAFYAAAVLAGQALVLPAMAYALSAFSFKGRGALFLSLVMLMLLPFQVTMAPNVLILSGMNLLGSVWAVILPMCFVPFYVFLLRQAMLGIPLELYEAAQLDGAGPAHCFFYVALPAVKPALGAAAALSFADVWNMVEQPLVFLARRPEIQPFSAVFNLLIDNPTGIEFAGAALYMLPALLVYLFLLEDISSGIRLPQTEKGGTKST